MSVLFSGASGEIFPQSIHALIPSAMEMALLFPSEKS
jgi:hypothetical protein